MSEFCLRRITFAALGASQAGEVGSYTEQN